MKKYNVIGAAGILMLLLSMSGCSGSAPATIQLVEQSAEQDMVTVTGKETVKVVPDMAQIVYTVWTEAKTASACQQENAEALDQAIAALKDMGIAETSIQTSAYGMNPRYDWSGDQRRLVGYEMETMITVTDIPIADAGHILTESVNAGVNGINSVSYFASSYDESYDEALKLAIDMAREKAEILAAAGGRQLGAMIAVEEQGYQPTERYNRAVTAGAVMEASNAAADMAVMPGEISVEAIVSVDFALE